MAVPGGADRDMVLALSLITHDLAGKEGVETALIAGAGPNGAAEVLAAALDSAPHPRSHDFVSRAVRAERPLAEAIDHARDGSLGAPASGARVTHAMSVPVAVPEWHPVVLCAGVSGPRPQPDSDLVRTLHAYARLASYVLREREHRGSLLGAGRDEVTGCLTYGALLHRLDAELDRCRRLSLELTCCFVGLQSGGHRHSNRQLAAAARGIRTVVSSEDSVGRYGQQDFIVVLPATGLDAGLVVAELISAALSAGGGRLDARVGVAQWTPGTGADRLLGDADHALTQAKRWPALRVAAAG
jgi:diguanylate cyclase (GGDEF)-like protein